MGIVYIKYAELLREDPVLARKRLIEVYKETGNLSLTASICSTDRSVVRRVVRRYGIEGEKGLRDRSRRPKNSPNRTPLHIESVILTERKKTGYGRDRISRNLQARGIAVKPSTVRYVLRRYTGLLPNTKGQNIGRGRGFMILRNFIPLSILR